MENNVMIDVTMTVVMFRNDYDDLWFTMTEDQARSLVRALSQVLNEPAVCGLRATCALYPKNKVAYHDEGAADPAVVVTKRED
jgi:hypothetical protein